MSDFLSKLTPVKRGMSPKQVLTPERIQAMQEAIFALWEGKNLTSRRGMMIHGGSGGVSMEVIKAVENRTGHRFTPLFAHGKLRIGLGTIGYVNAERIVVPYYPKFEDVRLDAAEAASIDVAGLTAGDYQVVVIFNANDGRVEVLDVTEGIVKSGDERVVQIATFTKLETGVEAVKHLWRSDILVVPEASPPFWVTPFPVVGESIVWKIYVAYGHVVPRHNTSADTGVPIVITGLPTLATPLTVVAGTKLWVKLTISAVGKCTEAAFQSGTTWEEDEAPELKGGDVTTGTPGTRYIRIAEIIVDPDSTATPPPLICNQLHTGHIDHYQNELCENTDTTGSAVMKKWDPETGAWLFRRLVAGTGMTINEGADSLEFVADGEGGGGGTGAWGTTNWTAYNLGGSATLSHTYENGILVNVAVSGDAIKTGAGTEAEPYSANIDFEYPDT
jgi:hypothetical protein